MVEANTEKTRRHPLALARLCVCVHLDMGYPFDEDVVALRVVLLQFPLVLRAPL